MCLSVLHKSVQTEAGGFHLYLPSSGSAKDLCVQDSPNVFFL